MNVTFKGLCGLSNTPRLDNIFSRGIENLDSRPENDNLLNNTKNDPIMISTENLEVAEVTLIMRLLIQRRAALFEKWQQVDKDLMEILKGNNVTFEYSNLKSLIMKFWPNLEVTGSRMIGKFLHGDEVCEQNDKNLLSKLVNISNYKEKGYGKTFDKIKGICNETNNDTGMGSQMMARTNAYSADMIGSIVQNYSINHNLNDTEPQLPKMVRSNKHSNTLPPQTIPIISNPIDNGGNDLMTSNPNSESGVSHKENVSTMDENESYCRRNKRYGTLPNFNSVKMLDTTDIQNYLHNQGRCKPCAFYYNKKNGCRNGMQCEFCHHEDHSKHTLKRWKKQQQKILRGQKLSKSSESSNISEDENDTLQNGRLLMSEKMGLLQSMFDVDSVDPIELRYDLPPGIFNEKNNETMKGVTDLLHHNAPRKEDFSKD